MAYDAVLHFVTIGHLHAHGLAGMGEHTDETLVGRACAGNREAFTLLIERHYERIYRVGARVLNDAAAAEDLAQEICVGLVTKLASFRGGSRFTTWLHRVVVNAALDAMRRDGNRQRSERDFAETAAMARADQAAQAEQSAWLRQTLHRLPDDLRVTVVLVLEEGLQHAEAGAVLGISEATVSWRMHQVRKHLRAFATEDEEMVHE